MRIPQLTSILKKATMGAAGFFLMIFLAVHLSTNLLMMKPDNGQSFQKAVEFMTSNPLIKAFEYVLFAAILIHILLGVIIKIQNSRARPIRYYIAQKSNASFFGRYMIWTGISVAIFLCIHFMHFFFVKIGLVAVPDGIASKNDFYNMAVLLFKNPVYSWTYIVLISLLFFHLYHAFQSFFQTIGFQHSRYFIWVKWFGAVYAVVIAIGFNIIPVYFLYFH